MFGPPADRDDEGVPPIGLPAVTALHLPDSPAEEDSGVDTLVAHVERVLGADSERSRLQPGPARPEPSAVRVSAVSTPTPDDSGTLTDARYLLRCAGCAWAIECLAADADRFAKAGCLMCGAPVVPQLADVEESAAAAPVEAPWNKRRGPRHRPSGATGVEVWRDAPGIGRNLAIALADVCQEGIGVYLSTALRPGDTVEVVLTRRGGPPLRVPAEVRWCAEGGDWTYRAGLRLCQPLAYQDMADLTV
ncbi:MAG TPA: PilZ domain-containing protein [Gemmataceae bacterium]|nr:PilZ domain-containing protein [Gemmataceae bacterium]